jgi:hypothetical protein
MKILKINTLNKGWCDKDHMILHAAFQLLVDFVEKEKPDQIINWNSDPEHKKTWQEIKSLYRWWTKTRPNRKEPLDNENLKIPPMRFKKVPGTNLTQLMDYDKNKYKEYDSAFKRQMSLEMKWHKEDQKNLHRLIDIRPYLWT